MSIINDKENKVRDKTKELLNKHINDLTKEDWEYLYNDEGMGLKKLGKNFGVCAKTVSVRMEKEGISRRPCGNVPAFDIDRETLLGLYEVQQLSMASIARKFSVSGATIKRCLVKEGIVIRTKSVAHKLPRTLLKKLYVDEKRPIDEIMGIVGVNRPTLYRYFHKYGFDVGETSKTKLSKEDEEGVVKSYVEGKSSTEIAGIFNINTNAILRVLYKHGVEIRDANSYVRRLPGVDKLYDLYHKEEKSLLEIAGMYGVCKSSVASALCKENIPLRSKSESKSGKRNNMYGKNHTDKTKGRMSDAYKGDVRGISEKFGRGNTEKVETPFQDKVTVRSSWEAAVCRYLNYCGIKYLYEPKRIELNIDGIDTTYTPDFLVYNSDDFKRSYYIEVKGVWTDEARAKVEAAIKEGFNIVVWEGEDLISKQILDRSYKPLY